MIIDRTFKYRIYPNKSTVARLGQWNDALKWLWNLAHEQRLSGYGRPKGERIYPTSYGQGKELTELRKIAPWINGVPRHVCVSILDRLDDAWNRCFDKIASKPKWKLKRDYVSFTEFDKTDWRIKNNYIRFPKLEPIPIVMSRPLQGKPKSCTIKRDGDQWLVFIVCEVEVVIPQVRTEPRIGIDRGIINLIADSDNRLLKNPKFLNKNMKRLARAQRKAAKKKKGSNNQKKAYNRVSRIHRKIRRQREHFLHVESTRYAKSQGTVVLEDLKIRNMVRLNRGMSRSIGEAGWGKFADYLDYKLKWSGGTLGFVNPAYTSQTCAACNHIDRASRVGDRFKCTKCGHTDHADSNGAKVILGRWSPPSQPVEASSQGTRRRSRKFKSKKLDLVD